MATHSLTGHSKSAGGVEKEILDQEILTAIEGECFWCFILTRNLLYNERSCLESTLEGHVYDVFQYYHLRNIDGPGRIQCLCSLSTDVPKWGLYDGVAKQNRVWRTVFYNGFRLFWDIVTGLATKTPNGVGFLEPEGYCIFLPGVHFLTLNDGADALLNKHNHTVNI